MCASLLSYEQGPPFFNHFTYLPPLLFSNNVGQSHIWQDWKGSSKTAVLERFRMKRELKIRLSLHGRAVWMETSWLSLLD